MKRTKRSNIARIADTKSTERVSTVFISLSRVLGKFRIGAGIRITKKNAWWMALIASVVYLFQFMWYLLLIAGWMLYAIGFAAVLGTKALYRFIKKRCDAKAGSDSGVKPILITAGSIAGLVAVTSIVGVIAGKVGGNKPEATTEDSAVVEDFEDDTGVSEDDTDIFDEEETTAEPETETTTQAEITTEPTTAEPTTTAKPTTSANPATSAKLTTPINQHNLLPGQSLGMTVYRTNSGEKYHYENPCGNGKYYPVTLQEALDSRLEPCDKCVIHQKTKMPPVQRTQRTTDLGVYHSSNGSV